MDKETVQSITKKVLDRSLVEKAVKIVTGQCECTICRLASSLTEVKELDLPPPKRQHLKSKNADKLASFTAYCVANPSQRFWQALCNWSKSSYIYRQKKGNVAQRVVNIYGDIEHIEDTWNL